VRGYGAVYLPHQENGRHHPDAQEGDPYDTHIGQSSVYDEPDSSE
jgi:hypothetical protein